MALGFFSRLKEGLSRSTQKLTGGITAALTKKRLDDEALDALEETLITADLGPAAAAQIIEEFRRSRFGQDVTDDEVKQALSQEIAAILEPVAQPLVIDRDAAPACDPGRRASTAPARPRRSASWRSNISARACAPCWSPAIRSAPPRSSSSRSGASAPARRWSAGAPGADPAGLAFDALTKSRAEGADVLLIDTAGRLHNKGALMEELAKIIRVLRKQDPTAPHSTLLVLDATTGQNAMEQVRVFKELVDVTGLVVTKLDGSARGGIVVALAQAFGLPVHRGGRRREGGRPAAVRGDRLRARAGRRLGLSCRAG